MKVKPMVSIIIPVYNGSNYIKEAIESALNQDYNNYEIIVVNDGSTDNGKTKEVILKYKEKVRYFEKENGGVSSALNYGISKMKGEYFSWLSHDDLYKENKLSLQIKELKNHDEKTILYSNYSIINEKGDFVKNIILNSNEYNQKPYNSIFNMDINGITLLIPKSAFEECGLFDESLCCIQDYDLWFKMMKKYKFFHMEEILGSTRVHSKQVSNVSPRVITEGNSFYKRIVNELDDSVIKECYGSRYLFLDFLENNLRYNSKYLKAAEYINYKKNKLLENAKLKNERITLSWIIDDSLFSNDERKDIISKYRKNNIYINFVSKKEAMEELEGNYLYFGTSNINFYEYLKVMKISNAELLYDFTLDEEKMALLNKYSKFVHANFNRIIIKNKSKKIDTTKLCDIYFDIIDKGNTLSYKKNKDQDTKISQLRYLLNSSIAKKISDAEFCDLCYQLAVIYNNSKTYERKIKFYEPCEKYLELSYSRAWIIYQKIINFIRRKK